MFGYALVSPLLLWLAAVFVYPLLSTIAVSFHDQRIIGTPAPFVGPELYGKIVLASHYGFWEALRRSVVWTAGNVSLQILTGLGVAVLLQQRFAGRDVLRSWIVVPWVIPMIVMAVIWRWMLDPTAGVVNHLLRNAGLVDQGIAFLGSVGSAMWSVIAVNTWRAVPLVAIVLLGALQAVPTELHEAARVDGATDWQRFRYVTIPQIKPTLAVMTLLTALWSFTMFAGIWLLTEGGPGTATTTLPILLYVKAFKVFRMGEGAALSVIMFGFLLVFLIAYLRRVRLEQSEA